MNKILPLVLLVAASFSGFAQESTANYGELHGNFQFDGQYYLRDETIDSTGEFYPDERFLGQGYANLVYSNGNFRAGIRYENYQNVMLGFPQGYKGEGITYRYIQWSKDGLDVTAGNFYEQFGSGMVLRAYEERGLGYDNMFDGVRLIYSPIKGLKLKGLVGKQRIYFAKSPGIVRALDATFSINDLFKGLSESATQYSFGGSFVSKFQSANDPFLNIPQNVGAGAVRFDIVGRNWGINAEYVNKANDPSSDNHYIFREGQALLVNMTYTTKGFGALISLKRVDNMSFRSDRDATTIEGLVNFVPATTKVHTYALPSLYPYATQLNGEMGAQGEFNIKVPRGSKIGGKYGADITLNYAISTSIYKDYYPTTDTLNTIKYGYETEWFKLGQVRYFQDFNVKWNQKMSKNFTMTFTYFNIQYNQSVLEDGLTDKPQIDDPSKSNMVYVNTGVAEFLIKLKPKHYLRIEVQEQLTKQDRGDMAMLLLEYSISPHWFFTIQDIYNYGNPDQDNRIHYPLGSVVYAVGTTRFQLSYGRQQRGIFCVGGVCRVVPPSNGVSLSVTTTF